MKKADVRTSYHSGHHGSPMLNVKLYAFEWLSETPADAESFPDARFRPWLAALIAEVNGRGGAKAQATLDAAYDFAREVAWDHATDDAANVFGPGVKVYSAGRCGGWLVVEGLPDLETWDAIALGRWRTFARYVAAHVDDVSYLARDALYHGPFAAWIAAAGPVVPPAEGV